MRVQFLQNFLAGLLNIDIEILENAGSDAVAFSQQAQKNMFRPDVSVIERLGFLGRESKNFLDTRCVGNVADHFLVGPGAHLLLDFHPHGVEVEAKFLQNVDGDALAELDQPQQNMLGADVVVIEAIRLFAGQRQNLLGAWRKIVHC